MKGPITVTIGGPAGGRPPEIQIYRTRVGDRGNEEDLRPHADGPGPCWCGLAHALLSYEVEWHFEGGRQR